MQSLIRIFNRAVRHRRGSRRLDGAATLRDASRQVQPVPEGGEELRHLPRRRALQAVGQARNRKSSRRWKGLNRSLQVAIPNLNLVS